MKKAIFAVHTEFHLMFTLKMINLLPEFKESQNIILRISPVGTNRLKDSYNFSGTGIEYRELFYNYGFFKEKGLKQAFEDFILSESPSYYVLFFEFLFIIMIFYLLLYMAYLLYLM